MKRLLTVLSLFVLFSGCASNGTEGDGAPVAHDTYGSPIYSGPSPGVHIGIGVGSWGGRGGGGVGVGYGW